MGRHITQDCEHHRFLFKFKFEFSNLIFSSSSSAKISSFLSSSSGGRKCLGHLTHSIRSFLYLGRRGINKLTTISVYTTWLTKKFSFRQCFNLSQKTFPSDNFLIFQFHFNELEQFYLNSEKFFFGFKFEFAALVLGDS